jgi:hypothetical protein
MSDTKPTPTMLAAPGTYYTVIGEQSIERRDQHITSATLAGLVEWVRARKADILSLQSKENDGAKVEIDREAPDITLTLREHGGSKAVGGTYLPSTEVVGSAKFSKDHIAVKALLANKYSALTLAETIQRNRHLFSDEGAWSKLVKQLAGMNFTISKIVEDTANDTKGERKKMFAQQITNVQEIAFMLRYSIYQGTDPVDIRVDVLYRVEHATVDLSLISISMETQERDAVNKMIDATVKQLREHLGDTIPFVEING